MRITHLPTNTVVQSQEQRSQIQNREVCMQMLRARLYEMELEKQQADLGAERQSQIGHGNRSEKIRTYNQPQDRVTDHRIGFNSTYNGVLLGDQLGTVIEALAAAERAEKLAQAGQGAIEDDYRESAQIFCLPSSTCGAALLRMRYAQPAAP